METQTKKHETVGCPRCGAAFECKVGSITLCKCVAVQLSDEQRDYVRSRFVNCLCAKCLQEVRTEYNQKKHQEGLIKEK
ncbi:cysteine-rich CWC family protein [Larkinella humicola]|uniref:Cysteine-rich CWC family protein n=1 Tax=Larkinella humicola TaxID=2607654 RepID=A0A5N1JIW9_9BACT|nr:cysteine-rich CWC family protein [Larkinella humicola]KAA9354631.1 cysteine-rich CWC family protein [Larkinella humicola]